MSPEEALAICRMAKGAFPATSMDEFTPEAWSLALEDDRFEDAKDALKDLMREQTFIHVSDIVRGIKRIRGDRLDEFGPIPAPPAELCDNPRGYTAWLRAKKRAIANGEQVVIPELPSIPRPAIDYGSVFQSIPDDHSPAALKPDPEGETAHE